jgi:hypothetical protein
LNHDADGIIGSACELHGRVGSHHNVVRRINVA